MIVRPDDLLHDLNLPQREAVKHAAGPLLVLAGAGSGKTRVITHRISYLLSSGCPADAILAITFTNKAATEMKERTERLCGMRSPWISTFHSFAARLLRRHIYRLEPYDTSFTICDRDDTRAIVKEILKEQDVDPHIWTPPSVIAEISSIKNSVEEADSLFGSDFVRGQVLRNLYHLYVERMEARNLLDFDDLLLLLVRLLREHPDILDRYRDQFHHVLIDEYQDTNKVQYHIGRLLTETRRNICITGDPDQSIYRWRGADLNNILNFEYDYPDSHIVRLEQNYRSTKNILHVANALISHNKLRKPKNLWSEKEDGDPVRVYRFTDEQHEARQVASLLRELLDEGVLAGNIAIFYRLNSLSRPIEQELIYANIPYSIVGGLEFFLRQEVKDLISYLRVLANPRDSESLKRILNVPPRGIGRSTLEKLLAGARTRRRGLLEVVLRPELRDAIPARQGKALDGFCRLHDELEALARKCGDVEGILRAVIKRSGYVDFLKNSQGDEANERLYNVGELVGAAVEYDRSNPEGSLAGFLEITAILADVDRWERRADRVSLMTMHAAKGLEFPVTVIVGVEEGILPLLRATDPDPDIEEERRLLYVGITRAKERLYITHTDSRKRFGQPLRAYPSRFLKELPPAADSALDAFDLLEMDMETEASLHQPRRRSRWRQVVDELDQRREFDDEPGSPERDGDLAFNVDQDECGEDGFEADEDPYPVGCRVFHEEYGEGRVVRASGMGSRRCVTVEFDEAGEKLFVIGYASLRRLG